MKDKDIVKVKFKTKREIFVLEDSYMYLEDI